MKNEYIIVDDFQINQKRVLILDSEYVCGGFNKVVIKGQNYSFALSSAKNWVIIESTDTFKGEPAKFIKEQS